MATVAEARVPAMFWIVGALALLWMLAGVAAYLIDVSMTPDELAALPEAQAAIHNSRPSWVIGASALAVFVGALGAIALLLRRAWARPLFIISFVAAVLQFGWAFGVARAHEVLGPSSFGLPFAVLVIGAALIWHAGMSQRRGWLR